MREAVIGGAVVSAVAVWSALGFIVVRGRADPALVRGRPLLRSVRWARSVAVRMACAIGAWPHAVDVARGSHRATRPANDWSLVAGIGLGRLQRLLPASGPPPPGAPPVLVVHSLVSRSSILDLTAETSVLGAVGAAGFDVWLLDWAEPAPADAMVDLTQLATIVNEAVRDVRRMSGAADIHVIGYCLGATLALLAAAAWPDGGPASLALIAPVVDSSADAREGSGMGVLLAHPWFHPALALDHRGLVPGPIVREAFHWLRPRARQTIRTWRAARASLATREAYIAMSGWTWSHLDLPGAVLMDMTTLYRDAPLMGLGWPMAGVQVGLERVRCPVLVIHAERDHIVPPASSRALAALAGGPVQLEQAPGGHVGMLVGRSSVEVLQPRLLAWLRSHSGQGD